MTRVYLESGKRWVFAAAVDWPGWCRRGRGEDAALETLLNYIERYRQVVGPEFNPSPPEVIGRVDGGMMVDFGAPGVIGPWDLEPPEPEEASALATVLEASWAAFDQVVAGAPKLLRKGPRGGGRDRDGIVEHVAEGERSYAGRIGLRLPKSTPWPERRVQLGAALRSGSAGAWPTRYAYRRIAWHILDHAWEVEDRS